MPATAWNSNCGGLQELVTGVRFPLHGGRISPQTSFILCAYKNDAVDGSEMIYEAHTVCILEFVPYTEDDYSYCLKPILTNFLISF